MQEGAAKVSRLAYGKGKTVQGRARVSASQPVACYLLPPVLAGMRQALPEVVIELVVNNRLSNLLMREADIALRMVRPDQSTLVAKRIGQVKLHACASRDYLRLKGTPQKPADLVAHDLITGDSNTEIQAGLAAKGFPMQALRFGLRTDDLNAQWGGISAGLGVGFAAEYLIRTDPNVSRVLPQIELPVLPIWLTVHRELHTSTLMRAVYDYLAVQVPLALKGELPPA